VRKSIEQSAIDVNGLISSNSRSISDFPRFDSKDAVLDLNLAVRGVNSKI
jgi:hypothetical protein